MSFVPRLSTTRFISPPARSDRQPPGSASMLEAYQRAHAPELRNIIADLHLRTNQHVLDMACGSGMYTTWLAEHVAPYGTVTGVDSSSRTLQIAQNHAQHSPQREQIRFQQGDMSQLPFNYAIFDLVWCAQRLHSLADPRSALQELIRVTRPGGTVVIFEHDLLHPPVLSWPPELELALRQAQHKVLQREGGETAANSGGRDLYRLFIEAGLQDCSVTPYSSSRSAPLAADERLFLCAYLTEMIERAKPHLSYEAYQQMHSLLAPQASLSLLDHPTFTVTYINFVARGTKPS